MTPPEPHPRSAPISSNTVREEFTIRYLLTLFRANIEAIEEMPGIDYNRPEVRAYKEDLLQLTHAFKRRQRDAECGERS